ncbi:hypothetical protein FN846DRAFT_891631 [Sphaerosporella brunnea]|uniref:Uncharacterized protein n=1 Tax=Sphaerosporella brunnea TaxID=1250544 RepID=A0A5J5ETG8_9PEZI|nr:hypothetical protein FN846DRAFT_891631 [Sphaerosporella brunnea]
MSTIPQQYNTNDNRLPSAQLTRSASRPAPDWLLNSCPGRSTAYKTSLAYETGIPAAPFQTHVDSASNGPPKPLPDWLSTVGPCVFCPTELDKNPGLKPGTREYCIARETKVSHHCNGIKPSCTQGTHPAPLAINGVDLRAIWERPASEICSHDDRTATEITGQDQPGTLQFNPVAPEKREHRSFTFNPESPEFSPAAFNNLEYLNQAVEMARAARPKVPPGSQEWWNAEILFVAALKKRSLFTIAQRRAQDD